MTTSHSRPRFRRRSLTALPVLLVPLLMTACASTGGSSSPSSAAGSGSTTSAASAGTSAGGAGVGVDLYKKYTTSAQFCALVPLADVSAAMQEKPAYPTVKLASTPVECTYAGRSASSIVSVEWSPKGSGVLDEYLDYSSKTKPVAIDVGGHAGRSLTGDVQVVVGDAAIDVFGIGHPNPTREAALAAAFLQKVG